MMRQPRQAALEANKKNTTTIEMSDDSNDEKPDEETDEDDVEEV